MWDSQLSLPLAATSLHRAQAWSVGVPKVIGALETHPDWGGGWESLPQEEAGPPPSWEHENGWAVVVWGRMEVLAVDGVWHWLFSCQTGDGERGRWEVQSCPVQDLAPVREQPPVLAQLGSGRAGSSPVENGWGCWWVTDGTSALCTAAQKAECTQGEEEVLHLCTALVRPPWATTSSWGVPRQADVGPVGAGPEDAMEMVQRAGAPLLWRQAGDVQPGVEKTTGRP